jgi:hypothetical protein
VVRLSCNEMLSEQREPMMADGGNEGEVPSLLASHWEYKGYRSIRERCRAQDIVAVIGSYISLDHRGVGSCPFKEHHVRGGPASELPGVRGR